MDPRKAALLAVLCGGLVVIGVFLPWYSISFDFGKAGADLGISGAAQSLNGTEGDFHGGMAIALALVAGIAAALLAFAQPERLPIAPRALSLVALAGFALAAVLAMSDLFRDLPSASGIVNAGRGIGIYVTVAAAAAGAWFSWQCARS